MGRKKKLAKLRGKIRRSLRRHIRDLGFDHSKASQIEPRKDSKDALRSLHRLQRSQRLQDERSFIKSNLAKLLPSFASGQDVEPGAISPRLELVKSDTVESDLFRLASLTWSVPVSHGYGRRMRFLVWDQSNHKLMGIFALGDPVFNLTARDQYVGWNVADRRERLVDVMDAYVLGAVPPYNMLLGGKVVSCLLRSREIRDHFTRRYRHTQGIISGEEKAASLVMITTSSALGKSAVYDRLKLNGTLYFEPVGFTQGWGHFHIPDRLFDDIRQYLALNNHPYASNHDFGKGPNWRLRAVRAGIELAGLDGGLLRHGIKREVYVCNLATNARDILNGNSRRPNYAGLQSVKEISEMAVARWVLGRARTRPEYTEWSRERVRELLDYRKNGDASLLRAPSQYSMLPAPSPEIRPPLAPTVNLELPGYGEPNRVETADTVRREHHLRPTAHR